MSTLSNLVQYIRSVAKQHIYVRGFITGELYETNDAYREYPLVILEWPVTTSYPTDGNGELWLNRLNINFTLHTEVKSVIDVNGNERYVTEDMIMKYPNQIQEIGLVLEDQLIDRAYSIMSQIASKIASDIYDGVYKANVQSVEISNVERVTSNDVYRASATFNIQVSNEEYCDIDNIFDSNRL